MNIYNADSDRGMGGSDQQTRERGGRGSSRGGSRNDNE